MAEANLDLAAYLAELEADVAKKQLIIIEIRQRLGRPAGEAGAASLSLPQLGDGGQTGTPGQIRNTEFFRMSIPEAIKKYLAIMKQPQKPKAIETGLKAGGLLTQATNFQNTLWTAIKRLEGAQAIVNTPHGWALSEWYPNRSKAAESTKKEKKKRPKGKKASPGSAPKAQASASKYSFHRPAQENGAPKLDYKAFSAAWIKEHKTLTGVGEAWKAHKQAANTITHERTRESR